MITKGIENEKRFGTTERRRLVSLLVDTVISKGEDGEPEIPEEDEEEFEDDLMVFATTNNNNKTKKGAASPQKQKQPEKAQKRKKKSVKAPASPLNDVEISFLEESDDAEADEDGTDSDFIMAGWKDHSQSTSTDSTLKKRKRETASDAKDTPNSKRSKTSRKGKEKVKGTEKDKGTEKVKEKEKKKGETKSKKADARETRSTSTKSKKKSALKDLKKAKAKSTARSKQGKQLVCFSYLVVSWLFSHLSTK